MGTGRSELTLRAELHSGAEDKPLLTSRGFMGPVLEFPDLRQSRKGNLAGKRLHHLHCLWPQLHRREVRDQSPGDALPPSGHKAQALSASSLWQEAAGHRDAGRYL